MCGGGKRRGCPGVSRPDGCAPTPRAESPPAADDPMLTSDRMMERWCSSLGGAAESGRSSSLRQLPE